MKEMCQNFDTKNCPQNVYICQSHISAMDKYLLLTAFMCPLSNEDGKHVCSIKLILLSVLTQMGSSDLVNVPGCILHTTLNLPMVLKIL